MFRSTDERGRRGIYTTPVPLVRFIVRSVDRLLVEHFGKEGLGDEDVRLLDPAAGPMNFVIAACRLAMEHGNNPGSRFEGIELVPEEHAKGVSAMRRLLGADTQSVPLLLADALADPGPWSRLQTGSIALVLGNPPWRGHSANNSAWIRGLLRGYQLPDGRGDEGYFRVDGKPLAERNPKWLADDYVKFLRAAQWAVDRTGAGIVAFVVNHTCLDAPTFRGVRRSLMQTFDTIYAIDFHGNRRQRERTPGGGPDEGVFPGIAQGAAILLLVKRAGFPKRVFRADLYGTRRKKLRALGKGDVAATSWTEIRPRAPLYLFATSDVHVEREFRAGLSLPEIFPVYAPGVITGHDALFTGFDLGALRCKIARLPRNETPVIGFLMRPFDVRFLLYIERLLERPRAGIMAHMKGGGNLGLVACRQSKEGLGAVVSRSIAGHKVVSAFDTNSLFPLYLRRGEQKPNLAPGFWQGLGERYGTLPTPEDILGYVYAVLYAPRYRMRYADLLRREFPRIAFPREHGAFLRLAVLGRELIALHLLEDPELSRTRVHVAGEVGAPLDSRPAYRDGRVCLNRRGLSFAGIAPDVWQYRIGAYQVLPRWLCARRGRVLTRNESRGFRQMVEALRRTLTLQTQIAEVDLGAG